MLLYLYPIRSGYDIFFYCSIKYLDFPSYDIFLSILIANKHNKPISLFAVFNIAIKPRQTTKYETTIFIIPLSLNNHSDTKLVNLQ